MPAVNYTAPPNSTTASDDDEPCQGYSPKEVTEYDPLAALQLMAKKMKKGVDQETRATFKQLLKTQDPRWRPDNPETLVVPPERWQTVPEPSPEEYRLKRSMFVQRSEGEGSQTPAAANGFKNREKLFSHFRQDKITGEEQEESEEPGQLGWSGG